MIILNADDYAVYFYNHLDIGLDKLIEKMAPYIKPDGSIELSLEDALLDDLTKIATSVRYVLLKFIDETVELLKYHDCQTELERYLVYARQSDKWEEFVDIINKDVGGILINKKSFANTIVKPDSLLKGEH